MTHPGAGDGLAVLSPGAGRVAIAQGARLRVYELQGSEPRLRYAAEASGVIQCLAFSPEGDLLVSGARDGSVAVWEISRTAKPTYTFRPHSEGTTAVVWSDTEGLFASAGAEGSLAVYGIDGKRLQGHQGTSGISSAAFTLGGCLLSGDDDGVVRLWTPFDSDPILKRRLEAGVVRLATTSDSATCAALDAAGVLTVWRGDEVVGTKRYPGVPSALKFSTRNPAQLGVAAGRGIDLYWVTGELQQQRRVEVPFSAVDFAWSAQGDVVALGTEGGRLLLHRADGTVTLPAEMGR